MIKDTIICICLIAQINGFILHPELKHTTLVTHHSSPLLTTTVLHPGLASTTTTTTQHVEVPKVEQQQQQEQIDEYTYPKYKFSYDVKDATTGDEKHHEESRDGDLVTGHYSVVEPDGSRRIVGYTATDLTGFNAIVTKEPAPAPPQKVIHQIVQQPPTSTVTVGIQHPVIVQHPTIIGSTLHSSSSTSSTSSSSSSILHHGSPSILELPSSQGFITLDGHRHLISHSPSTILHQTQHLLASPSVLYSYEDILNGNRNGNGGNGNDNGNGHGNEIENNNGSGNGNNGMSNGNGMMSVGQNGNGMNGNGHH